MTDKPIALEDRGKDDDGRMFSPSSSRNRDIIRETWRIFMPSFGTVLEIASGTGEHGAHITESLGELHWVYSDIDAASRASQAAWVRWAVGRDNLSGPLELDVTMPDWTAAGAPAVINAIFCANMIHIAPFTAAEGLLAGAGRHLAPGGRLMLYGPFARKGEIVPSNARFDGDLKRRDPDWGVRDLDRQIIPLAREAGLSFVKAAEMPANNLSVIFEKP